MLVFHGTFKKNDGTKRSIKFARLADLPKMATSTKRPATNLPVGSEVVWDLEKNGYRVFNWKAVVGQVTVTTI